MAAGTWSPMRGEATVVSQSQAIAAQSHLSSGAGGRREEPEMYQEAMAAVGGRPTRLRWRCCRSPHHPWRLQVAAAVLLLLSALGIGAGGSRETLRRGESILGNQTLVSAGGVFELGFFRPPGGSSGACYLGTWYKNITVRTVVWVCNRERSIADCSAAVFAVYADGTVGLLDGSDNLVTWVANFDQVTLLDSGNLIFTPAAGSDTVAWQSFDLPTDTWLPGMRLGRSQGRSRLLTSWRNTSDPSRGDFTLEGGPGIAPGTGRLTVVQSGTRRWEITVSAPSGLVPRPASNPWYTYGSVIREFTYTPGEEEKYVYAAASPFTRFVMDARGQLQLQTWSAASSSSSLNSSWTVLWTSTGQTQMKCKDPAFCGVNAFCNSDGFPICSCLRGFDPTSPDRWDAGFWSDGCYRQHQTKCAGDVFLMALAGPWRMFVEPYNHVSNESWDCEERCAANCSCTAYALAINTMYNTTLAGCFMWFGDLMGALVDFSSDSRPTSDLYIRQANATSNSTNQNTGSTSSAKAWPLKIAFPVVSVVVLICSAPLCYFLWRKCKGGEANSEEQLLLRDIGRDGSATYAFVDVNKVGSERGLEICVYSFSNVLAATDNFSDDKKLGQGGFGPVYKGSLPDGQEIAIKRLSTRSAQGLQEFKTEILIIARLQHKNLVKLLGCCVHREERLLIYEYMPNKSLDYFLFDPERCAQLEWDKRLQIVEGIAQGLLYLHKYSRVTIIHRDLKASNILLDSEMNPKISDFGMARIFSSNEDKAYTQRIAGTYGYMSPEYVMEGQFSVKSDVFSFGVLVLEIVSGRKNSGSHQQFTVHGSLLNYAWDLWNAGDVMALADPSLRGSRRERDVIRCIHVGLVCVQECADDRPTMAEAVAMLAGEGVAQQAPKQPGFFRKRDTVSVGGSIPAAAGSANGMSMSTMEGR